MLNGGALRDALAPLEILPRFVSELVGMGEEGGCVGLMLERAASVFECQLRHL